MSQGSKAKSARARATIAAKIIKNQEYIGRTFDDCFEMGDGREVMEWLAIKIVNDPVLASEMTRKGIVPLGDDYTSIMTRQAIDYALGKGIKPDWEAEQYSATLFQFAQ